MSGRKNKCNGWVTAVFLLLPIVAPNVSQSLGQAPGPLVLEPTPVELPTRDAGNELQPIQKFRPEYTLEARAARIEGNVILSLTAGSDGVPGDIRVVQSLDPGLDRNAVQSVSKWRFHPKRKDGQPISAPMVVLVPYRLNPDSRTERSWDAGITSAPRLLYKADPEYDPDSRAANIKGSVLLRATIGIDGIPSDIRVGRSLTATLDQKAVECAAKWRFIPAFQSGTARAVDAVIEVHFGL